MADVSPTLASSRSLITALSRPTSPVRAPSLPPAIARVRFSLLRELSRRSTHNFSLSLSLSPSAFLSLAPGHSGFLLLLLGPFPRFHVARPALFVPPLPLASTRCPMTSFVHPLSLRSPPRASRNPWARSILVSCARSPGSLLYSSFSLASSLLVPWSLPPRIHTLMHFVPVPLLLALLLRLLPPALARALRFFAHVSR